MSAFKLQRGDLSDLPSSLEEGDHYVAIDQNPPEIYIGPSSGGTPEQIGGANTIDKYFAEVNAHVNPVTVSNEQENGLTLNNVSWNESSDWIEIDFNETISSSDTMVQVSNNWFSTPLLWSVDISSGNVLIAVHQMDGTRITDQSTLTAGNNKICNLTVTRIT